MSSRAPEPYASRLRADLAGLKAELDGLLDQSTIQAVNADPMFITASNWRWGRSDSALTARRMSLLSRYISWLDRFRLLFPEPTRDISSKTNHAEEFVQRWLSRDKALDHGSAAHFNRHRVNWILLSQIQARLRLCDMVQDISPNLS